MGGEVQLGQFRNGVEHGLMMTYSKYHYTEGYYKDGLKDGIGWHNRTDSFGPYYLLAEYIAGKLGGFSLL